MASESHTIVKYSGPRDEDFKQLIKSVISKGNLKDKYIDFLTNEKSMKQYALAFTAESFDKHNNYENFEQMGDVVINHFIVSYFYRRFPQLDCANGVKVVARLRINYVSGESFAFIAENLNFWSFISAGETPPPARDKKDKKDPFYNQKYRSRDKKGLLEDVFEAFIGCTEYLLDQEYRPGVGYGIVYDILENIFNEKSISLAYEDLIDPKSRLKETKDLYDKYAFDFPTEIKYRIGTFLYYSSKSRDTNEKICTIYRVPHYIPIPGNKKAEDAPTLDHFVKPEWIIGYGKANIKIDSEQIASEMAIKTLKEKGIFKETPPEYSFFCRK